MKFGYYVRWADVIKKLEIPMEPFSPAPSPSAPPPPYLDSSPLLFPLPCPTNPTVPFPSAPLPPYLDSSPLLLPPLPSPPALPTQQPPVCSLLSISFIVFLSESQEEANNYSDSQGPRCRHLATPLCTQCGGPSPEGGGVKGGQCR